MANQKRADGADLWFVTAEGSGKLSDIAQDPHVNLAYLRGRFVRVGLGVRYC
jgi:general stress protein 26